MDQIKSDTLLATLLFVSLTALYASLTSSFPMLEDDGLFIMGAFDAGTAHSPGYPLFILLCQPFLWLPFGSVAFQVHLLNCLLGALTCSFLYLYVATQVVNSRTIALAAALSLAFSGLFFGQALVAEAYMLNVFLLVCLLWIPSLALNARSRLLLAAFFYGLALSNHWPLMVLMTPMLIAIYWPLLRTLSHSFAEIPVSLLGVTMGLAPYLWMYVSSSDDRFSHMGHFETTKSFFGFVLRDVYSNIDQSGLATLVDKILYLEAYAIDFGFQYSLLALPLILMGFVMQWRVLPAHLATGLTLTLTLPFSLILLLDFPYQPPYLAAALAYPLPLYVVMAVWLAIGLKHLCRRLSDVRTILISTILIGTIIYENREIPTENSSSWSRNIALQILYTVPENAVLIVSNSWSMAQVSYLHYVENVRPDLTLVSEYGAFLPERFSYFLPDREKSMRLKNTINAAQNVYDLAPLKMVDYPATDLGHLYVIKGPHPPADMMPALHDKPTGNWNQIYWYELASRNIHRFRIEQIQDFKDTELTLLYSRHLMSQESINPGDVGGLLISLDKQINSASRFNKAQHASLKGHLLRLQGNEKLADEFFAIADSILPGSGYK